MRQGELPNRFVLVGRGARECTNKVKEKFMTNQTTAINAVRMLAVDAIDKAKSGHPGICLGAAPTLTELYCNHLNTCVKHLDWINRDRFVLSGGHGVPMLYGMLHLMGAGVSIDDLKNLRQLHSITPGHPELGVTPGIDVSTGPLGQGVAMGVGLAIAERFLAAKFNKEGFDVIDHYTFVTCGDGDLQEGVTQEALSLAGHQKLNKLILLYDSNDVQLDGPTNASYTENVKAKYQAMGLKYICVKDGNDAKEIGKAIRAAKKSDKPTIIEIKTVIGYGSPVAGSCESHGAPLGSKTAELRTNLGWQYAPFEVPDEAYDYMRSTVVKRGKRQYSKWNKMMKAYAEAYPELAAEFQAALKGELNLNTDMQYPEGHSEATRKTGGQVLNKLSALNSTIIGGSADLTKSTFAKGVDGDNTAENPLGRNICFGVREHAMGAIVNGITLHGITRGFSGAFFVFSDYMKASVRLAALMGVPSVYVFTHDSIAVGEDGPTHQPIEQLAAFRAMPNLNVFRPCDAYETEQCFRLAFAEKHTPSIIVLTRQNLTNESHAERTVERGAYIIKQENDAMDICLLASGSEVNLAMKVAARLEEEGQNVRVVSMPNMRAFEMQNARYRTVVLPVRNKTIAIEASSSMEWYKYARYVYNVNKFGASAPAGVLLKDYGFDEESVLEYARSVL